MTAVIFDLDGTLVHSAPDIHAAVNRVLDETGAAALSLPEVTGFIGNGVEALIARVIAARGLTQPPGHIVARYMAHYDRDPAALTRLFPGVNNCLRQLAQAGHQLGVCTNKPETSARLVIQAFDLTRLLKVVVGGDTLSVRKPDPAPLLAAIAATGGGTAVFVGDSEVDAETARRAGVPFVLFTEGYRKTAATDLPQAARFSDFNALQSIIENLVRP